MKKYIIAILLFICCVGGIFRLACMGHDDKPVDIPVEITPTVIKQPIVEEPIETLLIEELNESVEPEEPVISETISVTGENRDKIATMMAKTFFGEARGIYSVTEQACVGWTILNRVDAGYGNIEAVITAEKHFCYNENFPTVDDYGRDLKALAEDIINRWEREHTGETDVGRVLPQAYIYFHGKNKHNWFRVEYRDYSNPWNYSLISPYES